MAKKISETGKPARRIEVSGEPQRRIEPETFAAALGAEPIAGAHAQNLDPVSLAALGSELVKRLRSSGGRPALADATEICRVPLSAEDVKALEGMVAQLEASNGARPSVGQLVSVIVHEHLQSLTAEPSNRNGAHAVSSEANRNPLHAIVDLLMSYKAAFLRVHQASTKEARQHALEEWRCCHPEVWGNGSVRDDVIRSMADPAKAWLSQKNSPYIRLDDFDLVEECAHLLSVFAISASPMSMPEIYSKMYTSEDQLYKQWNEQGERLWALHGMVSRVKELAARAGCMWTPKPKLRQREAVSADANRAEPPRAATIRPTEPVESTGAPPRDKLFISYSHRDKRFLNQLLNHLKPLKRAGVVSEWSDKQIAPGSQWFAEIKATIAKTKVAVLLVTSNFLASEFIHEHELAPFLSEAKRGGLKILWVPIRACLWQETPLKNYQAVGDASKPLAEMKAERDKAWVGICETIKQALTECAEK